MKKNLTIHLSSALLFFIISSATATNQNQLPQGSTQLAADSFSLRQLFFGSSNNNANQNRRGARQNQYRNQRYQRQQQYQRRQQQRAQQRRANQQRRGYYDQDYRDDFQDEGYIVEYHDGSGRVHREYHRGNPRQQFHTREQSRQNQRNNRYREEYYDPNEHRQQAAQQPTQATRSTSTKKRYNDKLCDSGKYDCVKAKSGDRWSKLFPDENQRDLVKRFNRTNVKLRVGSLYAVPDDLENASLIDIAPLDKKIDTNGEKIVMVNLPKLAFGAYDQSGKLVYWGPISGGKDWCGDIGRPCNTKGGAFAIFDKRGAGCRSRSFPVDRGGGAPMPYCMFFHTGFALHGSHEVPGYNASHGCIRMYTKDAKWLNENFIEMPLDENDKGTQVIVLTDDSNGEDLQPSVAEQESQQYDDSAFRQADSHDNNRAYY